MSEREGVRGLVAKWRRESEKMQLHPAGLAARRVCAVELESALAADGVQAGEVEAYDLAVLDDAAETLDRIGDGSAGLRAARARIASALSQQPEARGVVRHDLCGCPNGRAEHSPSCAALTEARNVR